MATMKYLATTLLLFSLVVANAQKNWWKEFPAKPDNYVTDDADVLNSEEEELLNNKLRAFEDSTSNQLFIYVATSLTGKNLEDYSKTIFNTWGIGQKDKNNGILIAIFISDREYRIQVGYGLEAVLTSEVTLQIQDEDMRHFFQADNFYEGIDAGVDKLIYYSNHEYEPPSPFKKIQIPLAITELAGMILFFVNVFSLRKWNNQRKRKRTYLLICILLLVAPVILIAIISSFQPTEPHVLLVPPVVGAFALLFLCMIINDKNEIRYDHETDDAYDRRMRERESRENNSSSSDDSFRGGGGGSSDSGGSSSRW